MRRILLKEERSLHLTDNKSKEELKWSCDTTLESLRMFQTRLQLPVNNIIPVSEQKEQKKKKPQKNTQKNLFNCQEQPDFLSSFSPSHSHVHSVLYFLKLQVPSCFQALWGTVLSLSLLKRWMSRSLKGTRKSRGLNKDMDVEALWCCGARHKSDVIFTEAVKKINKHLRCKKSFRSNCEK